MPAYIIARHRARHPRRNAVIEHGVTSAASGDHMVPMDGGSARDLRAAAVTTHSARQLTSLLRHRPPA
jgi:hypothetical protein